MDTTIIAALIGAAAALLAPIISKNIVEVRIRTMQPTQPLDRPTASVLRFLSAFTVKSAHIIHLKKGRVHVEEAIGLVIVVDEVYSALESAAIKFTVLGQRQERRHINLGSALSYQFHERKYYIICTKISEIRNRVELQVLLH